MASRKGTGKGVLKYPVFLFPSSLSFYMDDPVSLKQVVTLYNPYDIGITFKVYANHPEKYKVVDPVGSIKAKCCIDIVVRHTSPSVQSVNVTDKFRVDIVEFGHKEVIGRTYLAATLLPGRAPQEEEPEEPEREGFHSVAQERRSGDTPRSAAAAGRRPNDGYAGAGEVSHHHYLVIGAALVCIGALLLPTAGDVDPPAYIPTQLHLSTQLKLAFAYGLGLLTVAMLRPA